MSNQKPRTIEEQIRLLRSRGMAFGNEEKAKQCLAHISYFRLKYYWPDGKMARKPVSKEENSHLPIPSEYSSLINHIVEFNKKKNHKK